MLKHFFQKDVVNILCTQKSQLQVNFGNGSPKLCITSKIEKYRCRSIADVRLGRLVLMARCNRWHSQQ